MIRGVYDIIEVRLSILLPLCYFVLLCVTLATEILNKARTLQDLEHFNIQYNPDNSNPR